MAASRPVTRITVVIVAIMALLAFGRAQSVQAQTPPQYVCFPTCSQTDGRFLAMAGAGAQTLAGDTITIGFSVPETASSLEIGIFDGDANGKWDQGNLPLNFSVYSAPLGDGTGTTLARLPWDSTTMADNSWTTVSVQTSPAAQSPSGAYFYLLKVTNPTPNSTARNVFKLRSPGFITIRPQAFAFIAAVDGATPTIVFPSYPALTPTTYDGDWTFFLDVPKPLASFDLWDGDFDYGSVNCSTRDSDDPDTGLAIPSWAVNTPAVAEGAAVSTTACPNGLGASSAERRRTTTAAVCRRAVRASPMR